ncbi:hypothetical protein LAZ40_05900 [Cereibacter sphaeroides]|uniref:hypothetical protein n=1 Tax=Cereibacter sphaeroides TaxID=1063 RepID=UPI001F36DAE8|nr:hypothetical protein [Cereibacter sphaeroides]MCE6958581.1 hypothetical protein [Cereibacter sphaeroides]MCE6968986.1 hypothetical protein [Cereibacter sphaeroides]MCE6972376.1 hypothetical protein [Cereibacter sphaeroides]
MNMRPDAFGNAPAPAALLRSGPPLDEARIVPLTADLAALFVDRPRPPLRRPRLGVTMDGRPVPPPCIGSALALEGGGLRHMMILQRPVSEILAARILLMLDGRAEAEARPDWLQPPLHALPALVQGLAPAGREQFLKMFLTTGASLFAAAPGAALSALARQLLDLCGVPAALPLDCAAFGSSHAILSYACAAAPLAGSPIVALRPDRLVRLPEAATLSDADRLHLHLNRRLAEDEEVVIFAPQPVRLAPLGPARLQPMAVWIEGNTPAARHWALGEVRKCAPDDPVAQALLDELRSPDLPIRFETLSLAATTGGLLHSFRLQDPRALVRALRIERGGAHVDLPPQPDPDGTSLFAGLAALPLPADGIETCRLQLVLGSGRLRALTEAEPQPYAGEVPPGFAEAWAERRLNAATPADDPAQALAAARLSLPRRQVATRVRHFGPDRVGRISLIAPVGANPDLIPARAAVIALEHDAARTEVILTVAEGPRAALARDLAAAAAEIHDIPHRIVAHSASARGPEVLRAALALTAGPALLLGSEVLPATPGWLMAWLQHLAGTEALVTGGLIADHDGAIAEAGTELVGNRLVRPLAGLPATRLPEAPRFTSLPSEEYAGLSRAGIERLLALPFDHAETATLLADLAAADRREGRVPPLHCGHPFTSFGLRPAPEDFAEALLVHSLRLLGAVGQECA